MRDVKKYLLHMYLPQSKSKLIDALYKLFKRRALIKSNDAWLEKSLNPVQMILNVNLATSDV